MVSLIGKSECVLVFRTPIRLLQLFKVHRDLVAVGSAAGV